MRAWLFTILHNQYVNQVRRSAREGNPIIVEDGDPLLTSSAHQNKSLMVRDLERALTRLAPEQRAVVLLVGLEGMRYEEVAEILDVPVGTVRSRLSRGREMLRYLMGFTVPAPGTPVPRVAKRRARPFSLERYIGERPSVRRALALGATA
jgi:RNA polymerase sigma-70 factor (ECF subfamily)